MAEKLETVAYLFDYKEQKDDKVRMPIDMKLSKDDPRTSERWNHVEITEIHELVKRKEVE